MSDNSLQGYSLIFDIDGTICPIKGKEESYEDLIPYKDVVDKMKEYHRLGAKIVLFTSRNMKTYNGNIGLINKYTAKTLADWLDKWEIPYDEIIYGKPWPGQKGFYIDDRSIRPDEFVNNSLAEIESTIMNCKKERKF